MMTACGTSRANTLHDYLVNGRADSLKEAINLFEEEQHRMRVVVRVAQQHQDQHGDNRNSMQRQIFQVMLIKNHLLMGKRFLMEQRGVYVRIITRRDLV